MRIPLRFPRPNLGTQTGAKTSSDTLPSFPFLGPPPISGSASATTAPHSTAPSQSSGSETATGTATATAPATATGTGKPRITSRSSPFWTHGSRLGSSTESISGIVTTAASTGTAASASASTSSTTGTSSGSGNGALARGASWSAVAVGVVFAVAGLVAADQVGQRLVRIVLGGIGGRGVSAAHRCLRRGSGTRA